MKNSIHESPKTLFVAVFFFFLCCLIYGLQLGGELSFDSEVALTHNAAVQISGATFDDWRTAASSFKGSLFGRPIAMLSFAGNYALAGEFSVVQLKAINLFLHCLIASLVFCLASALLRHSPYLNCTKIQAQSIGVLAALIWLLHPLHVSTVLYVVQRMTQLSALFVLLGLWFFARQRGRWVLAAPTLGEVISLVCWLLLFTLAAVLSKENGLLLLWLLPVLEVVFFRGQWAGKKRLGLELLAWLAVCLPVVVIAILVVLDAMPYMGAYAGRDFSLSERLLTESRVLWQYFFSLVLPNLQAMALHHDGIVVSTGWLSPISTILSVLGWGVVIIGALALRSRAPIVLFAILFFLVGHALESTVLPLELVWEHRNYLPSISICIGLSYFLHKLLFLLSPSRVGVMMVCICLLLSSLLMLRVERWADALTLSRSNLINHPQSVRTQYQYASALIKSYHSETGVNAGDPSVLLAARIHYERMHQLDPGSFVALVNLLILDQHYFPELRNRVDWFDKLEEASLSRVLSASDFTALGGLLSCLDNSTCTTAASRVDRLFKLLIDRYPDSSRLLNMHYVYLSQHNDTAAAALAVAQRTLAVNPASVQAHVGVIEQYSKNGETGKAIVAVSKLLANDSSRLELQRVIDLLEESR